MTHLIKKSPVKLVSFPKLDITKSIIFMNTLRKEVKKELFVMQTTTYEKISKEEMMYIITYDDNSVKCLYDNGVVGSSDLSFNITFRKPTKYEKFLVEMNGIKWVNLHLKKS